MNRTREKNGEQSRNIAKISATGKKSEREKRRNISKRREKKPNDQ